MLEHYKHYKKALMEWSTTGKTPSEPHFENGVDYGGKLRRWQRSRVHSHEGGRGLKTAAWRENYEFHMKSGHVTKGSVNEYDLGQRLVQLVEVDRSSADAVAAENETAVLVSLPTADRVATGNTRRVLFVAAAPVPPAARAVLADARRLRVPEFAEGRETRGRGRVAQRGRAEA